MSRPRFLADEDVNVEIISGLLRSEPRLELTTVRELGLAGRPDPDVLHFAAQHELEVISHDSNTMTAHASKRIQRGLLMPGLAIVHQWIGVGPAIAWLLMVWEATEAGGVVRQDRIRVARDLTAG